MRFPTSSAVAQVRIKESSVVYHLEIEQGAGVPQSSSKETGERVVQTFCLSPLSPHDNLCESCLDLLKRKILMMRVIA